MRGIESIRDVEKAAAPLLIGLSAALLWWAVSAAGGFGPMLAQPSQFGAGAAQDGQFWAVFWPAITANVGFWATISLNIPDFTRRVCTPLSNSEAMGGSPWLSLAQLSSEAAAKG